MGNQWRIMGLIQIVAIWVIVIAVLTMLYIFSQSIITLIIAALTTVAMGIAAYFQDKEFKRIWEID